MLHTPRGRGATTNQADAAAKKAGSPGHALRYVGHGVCMHHFFCLRVIPHCDAGNVWQTDGKKLKILLLPLNLQFYEN